MFRIIEQVKRFLSKLDQQNVEELKVVEPFQQQETEDPILSMLEEQSAGGLQVVELSHQPVRGTLQEKLDSLQDDAMLQLWPPCGEYAGPVVINHPLILDGQGATFWAVKGPVVSIQSDRVSLCNVRIEVTGEDGASSPEEQCALLVKSGKVLWLDNVEVRGSVMGILEEEGEWKYPYSLQLGKLAHGIEHDLLLRIVVPVACKIASDISGLELEPRNLTPGSNEIRLHIERLPKDTLINGSIFLVSASLKRRISLTAHILSLQDGQVSPSQNSIVWEPPPENQLIPVEVQEQPPKQPEPEGVNVPPVSPEFKGEAQPRKSSTRLVFQSEDQLGIFQLSDHEEKSVDVSNLIPGNTTKSEQPQVPEIFMLQAQEAEASVQASTTSVQRNLLGSAFSSLNQNSTVKPDVDANQEPLPPLSPFLDQDPNKQQTVNSQDRFPGASAQATPPSVPSSSRSVRSQPINPLFEQTPSPSDPLDKPNNVPSSSRSVRSEPLSPIFEQSPAPSKPSDELDKGMNKESSPVSASQGNSQSPKRKILRPNEISPLFRDSAKKEQPDE